MRCLSILLSSALTLPGAAAAQSIVLSDPGPATETVAADEPPKPSIVLGLITEASFATNTEVLTPTALSFDIDDLEARRALRAEDPDLFASLLEGGAFDPPVSDLPAAIQQELKRMGCYALEVDGVFGNGSRYAVRRYFEARAGEPPEPILPDAELYRQIIGSDDVTCPPEPIVVRQNPPPTNNTTGGSGTRPPPVTNTGGNTGGNTDPKPETNFNIIIHGGRG